MSGVWFVPNWAPSLGSVRLWGLFAFGEHSSALQAYLIVCQSGKLTGILSFEVTNEADVFLHSLERSQLHRTVDDLYWVLQHLEDVGRKLAGF